MIDTIYNQRDDAVLRVLQGRQASTVFCILLNLQSDSGHKSGWTIKQSLRRLIAQGKVNKVPARLPGYSDMYHVAAIGDE